MNDQDLPIHAEMASAYLDGELDAAERATAAADPDVMALVDSFTRVRAELGDVKPVVDSTRTAAMAAALAEFDALHSPQDVAPATATVTSLSSRRMRAYRMLTGVAAAAVVGVIAVAALNSNGSDNDAATSAVDVSSAPAEELPSIKVAADAAGAPPADTAAAADSEAGSAESPALETATAALPEIDSAEALTEFATTVTNRTFATPAPQSDATTAPADAATEESVTPPPLCLAPDQTVIGAITFQGTFAYAVRDESTGSLRAIDGSDCRVLIEVEAP